MTTLYLVLLTLHNLNRWLTLLSGVWALLRGLRGLSGKHIFTSTDRRAAAFFSAIVHLQVTLGVVLFALLGLYGSPIFIDAPRRSFQWEHLILGLLAAIFATLGSMISKRAQNNQTKFRALSLWSSLALITSLLAIPWWRPLLRLFS